MLSVFSFSPPNANSESSLTWHIPHGIHIGFTKVFSLFLDLLRQHTLEDPKAGTTYCVWDFF